mgnify:CR=1 FL=1
MDRNIDCSVFAHWFAASPSSRRAWIEIMWGGSLTMLDSVALLAEGVDRNIVYIVRCAMGFRVALLAEGVDRNGFRRLQ